MNDNFEQDDLTAGVRQALGTAGGKAFKMLSKKGFVKKILIAAIPVILTVAVLFGTGLTAVLSAKDFFDDVKNFFTGEGEGTESVALYGQASDILSMLDNGLEVEDKTLEAMRLNHGTLRYLLTLTDSYNTHAKATRTITVQGKRDYKKKIVQVNLVPDTTSPTTENTTTTTTTTYDDATDYPEISIVVSNAYTEGMQFLDWRRLYFYSLFASLENSQSEDVGKITTDNINEAFEAIAMRYDYAFDVMTDGKDTYTYEECQELPHTVSVSGDPDTEAGELTLYYPTSLMNYAYSGHSRLVYTVDESLSITGIEEYYDPVLYENVGKSISKYYSSNLYDTYCALFPGGDAVKEQFDYYDYCYDSGNPVIYQSSFSFSLGSYSLAKEAYELESVLPQDGATALIPSFTTLPGSNGLTYDGDALYKNPKTVGEAAVNLALSRLNWKYSQQYRMSTGFWDCSSMICRIYHELGVDISVGGTTYTLKENAEAYGQKIDMADLQAGDVLWSSNSGGNHVVMYAGNSYVVHAKGNDYGTVYEPLETYLSTTKKTLRFCMRPYKNLSCSWTRPVTAYLDELAIGKSGLVSLDPSYEYAEYSKINTGKANLYRSTVAAKKGITVCVNAGHGTEGGSKVYTQCHPDGTGKVTSGTTAAGATTAVAVSSGTTFLDGTPEAAVTLELAKIFRDKLLADGYDVLMIRDSDDVQLDNVARTVLANNLADCHIALHWDSTTTDNGAFYLSVPDVESYRNMEPVKSNWQSHHKLGDSLIAGLESEGNKIKSYGFMPMDLTQTSYSTIPSVDIELGDRSSDHSKDTLNQLADGLLKGVNQFFSK